MRISAKSARNDPKKVLFIFEFLDEEDCKHWCSSLANLAEFSFEPFTQRAINKIVETLISRTDGKYGNKEHELSGFLFQDEACLLMMALMSAGDQYFNDWFTSEFGSPGDSKPQTKEQSGEEKEMFKTVNCDIEDELDLNLDF